VGETSNHIREDIEQTRGRMGETVEAIGYKTDVKSRVKDNMAEKKDALVSRVSSAIPDGEQVKSGARKVGLSKQNPLGLGIAAVAAGFVVGTLLPSTGVEDERLGEMSDQVGEKAREAGQEALERGKDVAREAVDSAKQTAGERTGSEADEMASSLRDKAQEVSSNPA
jgi:outer membrane murein-binding lipoprotein Lpp